MARIVSPSAINSIRSEYNVYNPVSLAYEDSILLEGARTNAVTYSQELDNAVWVKNATSISANAHVAPDGTATADKIVEDTTSTAHYVRRDVAVTIGTAQVVSFYVKAAERTWVFIQTETQVSYINLATGTTGTVDAVHTIRVTPFTNGWYRIEARISSASIIDVTLNTYIGPASGDLGRIYLGDGASGLYFWGLQIEADQSFCSSYIPTTNVAVTRSADFYSKPFNLPPTEMTVYCKFIEHGTGLTTSARVVQIGDAANPNLIIFGTSGASYRVQHHNGVSSVATPGIAGELPLIGEQIEIRAVLQSNGSVFLGQSRNNAAETVSLTTSALALPSAWSTQKLWVNISSTGGSPGFNAFLAIKVAVGIRTLDQMRAL